MIEELLSHWQFTQEQVNRIKKEADSISEGVLLKFFSVVSNIAKQQDMSLDTIFVAVASYIHYRFNNREGNYRDMVLSDFQSENIYKALLKFFAEFKIYRDKKKYKKDQLLLSIITVLERSLHQKTLPFQNKQGTLDVKYLV